MREPYTQLYLHLVWSTWDRLPLITPEIEPRVYAAIAEKVRELGCEPYAIGGISDHVHLLLRFTTTITIAQITKEVKGSSSHLVTHVITPEEFFKWQGGYGAFTIRKSEVPIVKAYILNQKQHHHAGTLIKDYELTITEE
jgi:REP element-mobilizing transposase RayT